MESLATRARAAFAASDFREAEKLYTKAISVSIASPKVLYFDRRAECYEKLHRLNDALRDSKHMLQMDPKDARGYLRCGKVYQLLDKDRMALVCYERGCAAVSKNDPLMKILKKLRSMVEGRLEAKVPRRDPCEMLPLELIWEIFSYCTFPQKLACLQISKRWHTMLTCDPKFYTKLELIGHRNRPNITSIENYIRKSRGKLEVLKIGAILNPISLKHHFTVCKDLQVLHVPWHWTLCSVLPYAKNLRRLALTGVADRPNTLRATRTLISQLPHLRHFCSTISGIYVNAGRDAAGHDELLGLRGLELIASSPVSATELFPHDTTTAFENLKEFKLQGNWSVHPEISWPQALHFLRFPWSDATVSNRSPMLLPVSLVALHIDCHRLPLLIHKPLPTLESLILSSYMGGFDLSDWTHLGESLKRLHIQSSRILRDDLDIILGSTKLLQELTISNKFTEMLQDSHLEIVARCNPRLTYLNLSENRNFTGTGLVNLVRQLQSLKELVLDDCDQIDVEVATWIRRQGKVRVRQNLHHLRK